VNSLVSGRPSQRTPANASWDSPIDELEIEHAVAEQMEAAAAAGVLKPTYAMQRSVTNAMKSRVYEREDVWNKTPNILVFRNTALDTSTMGAVRHDPEHKATVALPYDYERGEKAHAWEKVLHDVLSEDERKYFQEFAGYCLTTGVQHQMALWLYGPPGSAKSTLIAGLEAMLGDLAGALSLTQLQSRFGLAATVGKTLLTCTEVPKQHMKATDVLNALITGDTIQVEQKYKDAVTYRNTAKLVWAMNTLPGNYEGMSGLFRRVKVFHLESIPADERDPRIIEDVRKEGAGIINWALDGLARLNGLEAFDYPESVLKATERYRADNDIFAQFADEGLDMTGEHSDKVKAGTLTTAFNNWAKAHGYAARSDAALKPEWERLGMRRGNRTGRGYFYHGGKLKGGEPFTE
jgi:putative DNA primase/helicase